MSPSTAPSPKTRTRTLLVYGLMLVATVLGFLLIRYYGADLRAPTAAGASGFGDGSVKHLDSLLHVLIALVVVIVAARLVGSLFAFLGQPPVVGEILAGILLGPSLLGRVAPALSAYLLPTTVAPILGILSQVGVILYMFLVGLELDPTLLRKRGEATLAISHASIITPFLLGALLSLAIYPRLSTQDVPFTIFALFLGVSMSVTAFPVLARILTDRRIHKTRMGVTALTCAAIDDVTAWCLLAFVVSLVQARGTGGLLVAALAGGYIAVMMLLVRPAMVRLTLVYGLRGRLTQGVMAVIFVALLLSALATELIGIHAVFGAFLLGAIIPHDSGMARDLTDRLEDLVVVLFLPSFFAFTGLRTQIGLVSGAEQWLLCGVIIVVASVGKFGGSFVAARLVGLHWREATALGILMNTRGLMELIVLNIGLDLRVISPTLFAMMVLMALVTTLMTSPLLALVVRGQPGRGAEQSTAGGFAELGSGQTPGAAALEPRGVLVPIANPSGMAPLVDLATAATLPDEPPPRVLALVRRPPGGVRTGLREVEHRTAPRTPILAAAMEHARARGQVLDLRAVWTDDPADDIISEAEAARARWLIVGYHRPVFGGDLMGGVVKQLIDQAPRLGRLLRIAVVIHGHERPLERVIAVVDDSADGRAALDLAQRLGRRTTASVHAVLVPRMGTDPEPELQALLRDATKDGGRWLHTDVLAQRNPAGLTQVTRGDLVVMGMNLTDELGLPLDDVPGAERCVVVVRGVEPKVASAASVEAPVAQG